MEKVNPWWITGISDGESCFQATVERSLKRRCGSPSYHLRFEIVLRDDDTETLNKLHRFFGIGNVYRSMNPRMQNGYLSHGVTKFLVCSVNDLKNHIIPHFDSFPLQSKKHNDYVKWRELVLFFASRLRKRWTSGDIQKVESMILDVRAARAYKIA